MITNAQIALKWHDQHLIWDAAEFNNQSRIVLSSKDIWTPGKERVLENNRRIFYLNYKYFYFYHRYSLV